MAPSPEKIAQKTTFYLLSRFGLGTDHRDQGPGESITRRNKLGNRSFELDNRTGNRNVVRNESGNREG